MRSKIVIVLGLVLVLSFADTDITNAQGGESAVPFLMISPNSRNSAIGESGAGLADDVSAIFWNPAGLAFQSGVQVSLTHSNWLPALSLGDMFYEFLAFKYHLEDLGMISASVTFLNLGEFVRTGEVPDPIETWRSFEYAITAGFSAKVLDDLGIGVNLRFIHSSLSPIGTSGEVGSGVATSVSGDIGLLYRPTSLVIPFIGLDLGNVMGVGLNLSNLGPKISYIDVDQADPIPTSLRLGFAFNLLNSEYNSLTYTLDFNRLLIKRYDEEDKKPDEFYKAIFSAWQDGGLRKVVSSTGLEYWYGKPKLIAVRFGYLYEDPSFGNRKFLSYGAGIRYDAYGFDFSYISSIGQSGEHGALDETMRFSLIANI
jgi:hypothetical protein